MKDKPKKDSSYYYNNVCRQSPISVYDYKDKEECYHISHHNHKGKEETVVGIAGPKGKEEVRLFALVVYHWAKKDCKDNKCSYGKNNLFDELLFSTICKLYSYSE